MQAFVSTFEMKCDAKGRVSIPKVFRQVLQADFDAGAIDGLYCTPSPDGQAIDAGGAELFAMYQGKLANLDPTSFEYDLLATAFFGESEIVSIEKEGRMSLPTRLKINAGIDNQMVFVGKGHKFQIWAPERYAVYRQQAVDQARTVLWGKRSGAPTTVDGSS